MTMRARHLWWVGWLGCGLAMAPSHGAADPVRTLRFTAQTMDEAAAWQRQSRAKLFELMMGGRRPESTPLAPELQQRVEVAAGGFVLEEWTLQSLPDRRLHAWLAVPLQPQRKVGAVLALHGHGGTGEEVVRGRGLYWYGRALAEMGYVVIAPDIGSHTLQHPDWSLMGERVWDSLRCLDYLGTRPEVDPRRIAVAGLSLGGETAMYVAALDERVRAVDSSGWLTTVANMKQGHCPCWSFPGLEEHFDFADIFACVAPRPLVLEVGEQERAPGGFPVELARAAWNEIRPAYRLAAAEDRLCLDIHPGGHVFHGCHFWGPVRATLGPANPFALRPLRPRPSRQALVAESLRRGELARRCFSRALGVLDGWWALRDRETGLFPRRVDQPVWAPQDNAADMLPFLFLTAHYLAPERLPELSQALHSEAALTSRLGPLPDWYALTNRSFLYEAIALPRLIFNAAEYCKDGLVPMTEVMGRGPWTDRMLALMNAIFQHAAVPTDFGMLPADDSEVNGDILQALARLHALTRESKYLEWAERIGDAYCLEVLPGNGGLPPHRWDFEAHRVVNDRLNLNDHGNEIIGGLAELYLMTRHHHPAKADQYRPPLRTLFQRLLTHARNEDGFWFNLLKASTAEPLNRETPDTWGYALSAAVTFGLATEDPTLAEAARHALQHLDRPRYLDWNGADSYADSLEGALLLLNRLPEPQGFAWLEQILPLFLGKQREDGIVEGWYGDGNYARTALMAGLYFTQGTTCRPWRPDLRWGAVRDGERLQLALTAPQDWQGRIGFDRPRHRVHLQLPVNYPRLNEFPEWFVADPEARYRVSGRGRKTEVRTGRELSEGLPVQVRAGAAVVLEVTPLSPRP